MATTPYTLAHNSAVAGTGTFLNATSSGMTDGDSIIVGVLCTSGTIVGVTDTSGTNTYSLIGSDTTNASSQIYVYACYGASQLVNGVDSITAQYSTSASVLAMVAVGDPNVTGSDIFVTAHGTSTTASKATGVLNQSEEHILAFIVNLNAGGTPTLSGGLTALQTEHPAASAYLTAGYHDVTTAVTTTPTGTITSAQWAIAVVTDTVAPVSITSTPPSGVVGVPYSSTQTATGGISPYTWTLASGTLPTGVTLSSGVLTGTPTVAGTYVFSLTATDSPSGSSDTEPFTVVIAPSAASATPAMNLPHNLISTADSGFESGTVGSWVASANASSVSSSSAISNTGSKSLKWTATADGISSVITGFYPIAALKGVIASAMLLAPRAVDCFISLKYYTSGSTLISESDSIDWPTVGGLWQPLSLASYTPATTAKFKILITVGSASGNTPLAGDVMFLDTVYTAEANSQILIDWVNPAFSLTGGAGAAFMDCSMFTRLDQGISINYGRQDAVSEIQTGSASFMLQNDSGWFSNSVAGNIGIALGGDISLHARCQINFMDEAGTWHTRWDGAISEIDYVGDNTGNTNIATIQCSDVMAYMNREDSLNCWTKEHVFDDGVLWHWSLDDAGNTGASGLAAETSGNGGPPMRTINSDAGAVATIAWQDTTGGVETLADASKAGKSNGASYWSVGSNQPSSQLRGLDSGAVGPFTSPSPSVYLVPHTAAQSARNTFLGNAGYGLTARIPPLQPTQAGSDFSVEMWFTCDPSILANAAVLVGPYIQLTLGNSKTQRNVQAGIFLTGTSSMTYTVKGWDTGPAFATSNFSGASAPSPFASMTGVNFIPDSVPLPHHLVLNVQGDPTSPTITGYLDTVLLGSFNLRQGENFDTIMVGTGWNGLGAHAGGVQLVSVAPNQLTSSVMNQHCKLGQYGMWEQTSDDCIASIADFANVPQFWNALQAQHNGLTMTEYQDLTGSNALTAMQLYEQGEAGLIYVNSAGQLQFQTRDMRFGKGVPDLVMPPDTFDANVGLQLIDQYMINEQAVSSQLFQSGAAIINDASQNQHGVYAQDPVGSPVQLPFLSWSRAFGQVGLSGLYYWPDPMLDDFASWSANSRSEPWLLPGQLTIDLLTLNTPTTGLKISSFYGLDIGSLISQSGTQPQSWPSANLSTEWFIEGVIETFSQTARTLQYYCSAAEPQKAWQAGDPVYGVLGTTTRVGISTADLNKVQAYGKNVSHDAGRPYWPNDFTDPDFLVGDNTTFTAGIGNWVSATNCSVAFQSGAPGPAMKMTSTTSGDMVATHCTTGNILTQGYPCTPGQTISVSCTLEAVASPRTFVPGATFFDNTGTLISTIYSSVTATDSTSAQTPLSGSVTAPAGAFWCRAAVKVVATGASSEVHYVYDAQIGGVSMNNPAQNGHDFVGGVDIRGITDNLYLLLEPPILVAQANGNTQSVTGGSGMTQPQLFFDDVYVDTAGGMGAIPGWPNWYVVTVPGFYEIDAVATGAQSGTGGAYWEGWIVVARQAAQAIAAGTGNPVTVGQYVCPIGESKRVHSTAQNVCSAPTTRMYLGLGDMIAVAAGTTTTISTGTANGATILSLIFKGLSALDDEAQVNSSISTGGSVSTPVVSNPATFTYLNTATYSYYGNQVGGNRKNTNGVCYQSAAKGYLASTGTQKSQIKFNTAQMITDLTGKTISSVTVTCTNQHTWYGSGGYLELGVVFDALGGSKWNPKTTANGISGLAHQHFNEGQTLTFTMPNTLISYIVSSGGTGLFVGMDPYNDSNLNNYGYWTGGPNTWTITVNTV